MAVPEPQLLEEELLPKHRDHLQQLVDRTSSLRCVFSEDGLLGRPPPSRVNDVYHSPPGCVPAGSFGPRASVHRQQSRSLASLGQDLLGVRTLWHD